MLLEKLMNIRRQCTILLNIFSYRFFPPIVFNCRKNCHRKKNGPQMHVSTSFLKHWSSTSLGNCTLHTNFFFNVKLHQIKGQTGFMKKNGRLPFISKLLNQANLLLCHTVCFTCCNYGVILILDIK